MMVVKHSPGPRVTHVQDMSFNREDAGAVRTQRSAKTLAFDSKAGKIFLSAAEYRKIPREDAANKPRRALEPGSFVVLFVAKARVG